MKHQGRGEKSVVQAVAHVSPGREVPPATGCLHRPAHIRIMIQTTNPDFSEQVQGQLRVRCMIPCRLCAFHVSEAASSQSATNWSVCTGGAQMSGGKTKAGPVNLTPPHVMSFRSTRNYPNDRSSATNLIQTTGLAQLFTFPDSYPDLKLPSTDPVTLSSGLVSVAGQATS